MKVRNKNIIQGIVLFLILAALGGVITGSLIFRSHKTVKIIYVSKSKDYSDFWSALINGATMAAKEQGAELKVVAPQTEQDVDVQNDMIMEAVKEKPDVILLSPADYDASLAAAEEIKKNNIKLVLIDSLLSKKIEDSSITTDNVRAAQMMGEYMKDLCTPDTQIGIVNHVKVSSTGIDREKGIRKGLGDCEKYITDMVYSESNYDKGYEETKSMLLRNPEINMIAATNEYSTTAAGRAVKDMGLAGKVRIVGFDNSIDQIQMLESGVLDAIVIQKPFDMGYLGVREAVKLVKSGTAEKEIDSGCKLITKDTIYTEENQKLLFSFIEKGKTEKSE